MTLPIWAWAGTLAVFAALMAADLVLTRKAIGWRAAVVSSALWIAAALAFGGVLWLWRGPGTAGQYFAGYLLEKAPRGLLRGRRVPRRQPLLPARPPLRAARRAPVLPKRERRTTARLGRALA